MTASRYGGAVRIRSLARATAILEVISKNEFASLAAICRATGLNKTTAFYLVESLVGLGFADRAGPSRGYRLGLRNLEFGAAVQRRISLLEISRPALIRLCAETKETVNLAVPYLLDALIIESLEGSYGVRATSYAGTRAPYHATACGKVMLAQFEPAERQAIYAARALTAFTPNTITDLAVLEMQLEEVRQAGYALDLEEYEDSAHCAAAPIFDGFGRIAGSISLAGLKNRMAPVALKEAAALIAVEAKAITARLGEKSLRSAERDASS